MALPSSGYLGQWFSTKQLFLKFSRIFRILIKVQVISLLSDITDRLARAFFSCVLSGNSSENEYVQKRITAHAVGTVNTSCDFTGSIQTRNRSSCCIQNLRFGVGIEAAHRVVDCHSGITSPEGTLSNFSGQIPRSCSATACGTIREGVALALEQAGPDGTVLCYGSLYLIGDVELQLRELRK